LLAAALVGLALLAGCAEYTHEELMRNTVVFGGVNMDDAPTGADAVTLKAVTGPDAGRYWRVPVKDGVFYHEGLPPASYQLWAVWGHSGFKLGPWIFGSVYEYDFGGQADGVRVTRGGSIVYAGSFRIVKQGGFFSSKFSVEPDSKRSVKAMVQALIPRIRDDGVRERVARWLALFK
jgi:hypothetical protein